MLIIKSIHDMVFFLIDASIVTLECGILKLSKLASYLFLNQNHAFKIIFKLLKRCLSTWLYR